MNKNLFDIVTVARYELLDSIRSRRFVILLMLYMVGSMLACNGLLSLLQQIENQVMETLKLTPAGTAGAVTDTLIKSPQFTSLISGMVSDKEVVEELLSMPPLALIYTALIFFSMPLLIMFSAPFRIADEVSCGSVRFALIRTTRWAWCVGKFLGQALEVVIPLLLTVIGFWVVARFKAPNLAEGAVLGPMLIYALKVWVYCLAYIGLALGASQIFNSGNKALVGALSAWIGITAVYGVCHTYAGPEGWRSLLQVLVLMFPAQHQVDLWRPDLARSVPAMVYLFTIAMAWFCTGHLFFKKKSL